MHKILTVFIGSMLVFTGFNTASAQSITISGSVTDKLTRDILPGASITVKGKTSGTTTDVAGKFSLTVNQAPPVTIIVTYVGYKSVEQQVSGSVSNLAIELESGMLLGQEIVIAASRAPERILESPVSIEQVSSTSVRESAAPSFYDALSNLKGVESSVQSLTFRSINTRGFNANGNERFNQFIDGMDNQAPGLNFSVGNIVGISDLDVASAEILPGASSALYGAGGTNGTLLMNSKSPFTYPGLSVSYKLGFNHIDNYQTERAPYEDMSLRYAKSWNNKFAFKVNVSYLSATDWNAKDYSNFDRFTSTPKAGDRNSDPNYDGVNVYGDEPNRKIPALRTVAAGMIAAGFLPPAIPTPGGLVPTTSFIPNSTVSRTGYFEKDLVDYNTSSFKTSNSIHYKFSDNLEAIAQANWGMGVSVYTGLDRYSLKNFSLGQYKLELKGSSFYLRGYSTEERSGDAYNATLLGTWINEAWAPDPSSPTLRGSQYWYPRYTGAFLQAKLAGQSDDQAHVTARAVADQYRPQPGSSTFETLKKQITAQTIGPPLGAKFHDKSNLRHFEGMYNFTNALNNALELQVGSSYRIYNLKSDGTIFDDLNQKLNITEYGAFVQIGKRFLDEKLKLTGAARYDKSENFEGRITPRLSGVYTVAPNNNIRLSYQTGFRNPTTQNQYIDLLVGGAGGVQLIGGLPQFLNKYNLYNNRGYTLSSIQAGTPQQYTFGTFKPESVQAYEIGYKGLMHSKILVDVYYYYNSYKNFISTLTLLQAPDGTPATLGTAQVFSTAVNDPNKVKSQGAALGLDYLAGGYNITGNISYNSLTNTTSTLQNEYNTPKYRLNVGLANRELFKNTGFNVTYRWQDKFNWYSTFAAGEVPAFSTVDGQISYKLTNYQSVIKIGGSNLLNHYYRTSYGNPQVGAVYYVSLTFDQFGR